MKEIIFKNIFLSFSKPDIEKNYWIMQFEKKKITFFCILFIILGSFISIINNAI